MKKYQPTPMGAKPFERIDGETIMSFEFGHIDLVRKKAIELSKRLEGYVLYEFNGGMYRVSGRSKVEDTPIRVGDIAEKEAEVTGVTRWYPKTKPLLINGAMYPNNFFSLEHLLDGPDKGGYLASIFNTNQESGNVVVQVVLPYSTVKELLNDITTWKDSCRKHTTATRGGSIEAKIDVDRSNGFHRVYLDIVDSNGRWANFLEDPRGAINQKVNSYMREHNIPERAGDIYAD